MSKRDRNREQFSGVAAMVDQVREVWPGAKVIWATEGGREIGRKPDDSEEWIGIDGDLSPQHKGTIPQWKGR